MSQDSPLAIKVESITPEVAQSYLDENKSNRTLRNNRVKSYAAQMQRGQWQLAGDPIRFDTNGRLIDGQHRLHAVVMANVAADFVVIRGLEPETFIVIDSGLNRSPADSLGAHVTRGSHKAAGIRILYVVEAGGDPRKTEDRASVTRQDIHEYYSARTEIIEEAALIGSSMYVHAHGNRSAWIAFAAMTESVPVLRQRFLDGVKTGAGLNDGDPRLALRNWLLHKNNKRSDQSGDHIFLYVKAWNDWMKGTKRSIMRLPSSEERFPVVALITKEGYSL